MGGDVDLEDENLVNALSADASIAPGKKRTRKTVVEHSADDDDSAEDVDEYDDYKHGQEDDFYTFKVRKEWLDRRHLLVLAYY